jgi:hypothetical protein
MVISPLLAGPLRDSAEIPDLVGPHGYLKVYIISSNDEGPPGQGNRPEKWGRFERPGVLRAEQHRSRAGSSTGSPRIGTF